MNLIAAFVRNPVKVAVGVLLVGLFGLIALGRLPIQLTPEVQTPTITIETRWPGASPQEVEREIVQEQEEQLKGVEGLVKMTGECMDSRGQVTLEFIVGTDMASALLKVNTRLQQVREYPEDAQEPVISTASSSDQPIGWFIVRPRLPTVEELRAFADEHPDLREILEPIIASHSVGLRQKRLEAAAEQEPRLQPLLPADIDVAKQRRFIEDTVEARFERVPGVANANVIGGREEELQVVVDPQRLASRRITIADVREALRGRNADTSAGDYWEGKRRYVVRTLGQFDRPEEVEGVLLARRDGRPVYIRDVAEVRLGFRKSDTVVRNFGTDAVAVNAVRETGANVLEVMAGLREAVEELSATTLKDAGLQIDQVYDETEYIYSAIGLLTSNLLIGGTLTILALLIFLRSVRSTLVIGLAIPTSIVGSFLLLDLMGRSLNVISLAGMAFAIGMLVDNAVVVLENVYRHWQQGARRFEAAVKGTAEVWGAVVASTLTTLAVFIPVLFIEEEAGQLFRDIALAISCSVGLSLIVSVTLIPTATSRILPSRAYQEHQAAQGKRGLGALLRRLVHPLMVPFDLLGRGTSAGVIGFQRWLQRGVLRQLAVIVLLVGLAAWGALALWPKTEYLPEGNRNLVIAIVVPPPGYNVEELVGMGVDIEQRLQPYWNVDAGTEAARELDGPVIGDFFFVARGRQVFLGVKADDPLRAGELVDVVRRATRGIPGTYAFAQQSSLFNRGLTAGRSIDVEITGPDLRRLVMIGGAIMGQVYATFEDVQAQPIPSLDLSNPEVHVTPLWEQAADLGVTAQGLGYTVDSLVDGAYAGDYYLDGDKIDITIVGEERFAGRLQDLEDLPVATPTGALVPLQAVAKVELGSGPEQINHRERQRAITIQVKPSLSLALESAVERIEDDIVAPLRQQGMVGGAYQVTLAGTADKLRQTWAALSFNIVLAVLITYLLMAALFESWLYPFVIIFSVPLGAVGGILGLTLLNVFVQQQLDVLTMIGFVILIGTVVNNAILIVHQALVHMREEGMEPPEAIVAGVRNRIRPIFMTVTTTVFGLLPLVLFPGAGSELYRGLGAILIGGLVVSTVFTLFLVPALFRVTLAARARTVAATRRLLGLDG